MTLFPVRGLTERRSGPLLMIAVMLSAALFMPVLSAADVPDVDWPVTGRPTEQELAAKCELLSALISKIESAGLDASYARNALMTAKEFIGYAEQDAANVRPKRAAHVRSYLAELLDAASAEAESLIGNPALNRPVPRPPLRDITIRDGAFFAGDTQVMFGGVGHFGKVRADIPKFGDYGFNLIQIEIGPNSVVTGPGAGDIRTDAITSDIIVTLDRAAEHGVMVNLLLSPHYFPKWAMDMYPQLNECGIGFIKYCVSDAAARDVLRRYLEVLIPMVKSHPALQSYTLANEPVFREHGEQTQQRFRDYLKDRYGDISALNRAWGKKYRDFDKVRIGDDIIALSAGARLDWSTFHNSIGTEFFDWMKSVIRTMDSQTPVNIKFMDNMFENNEAMMGIDREALGRINEISGNDSAVRYPGADGYAINNRQNAAFFDFLKSVQPGKPIQNSENHIITDDSPLFYPEEFIHSALMIQYLHGMGASTIWVWERGDGQSLGNNILSRPNCASAAGRATLDARRLAHQITALANSISSAPVALYYSQSTRALQFDFLDKWNPAYEVMLYRGRAARIVTDGMLEAGLDPAETPVLVVPEYIYTTGPLFGALVGYISRGGSVVTFGTPFRMNEYGRKIKVDKWETLACGDKNAGGCVVTLPAFDTPPREDAFRALNDTITNRFGVPRPELYVVGLDAQPVLGVEYRSAEYGGGRFAFVFNALDRPADIQLAVSSEAMPETRDLISGREVPAELTLEPFELVIFNF